MTELYGTVLDIDLSERRHKSYQLDQEISSGYVGGSGIAAKILADSTDGNTEPLSPENVLIFSTGPLTGTPVPSSGRHAIVSKSPLTSIYCESDVGGYWGTFLRRAGFDILVVRGASSEPIYVWIHNGIVEIRPASHVWGKDTIETDRTLKMETHAAAVTALIGPAGENKVLLASIMHDGAHGRAAGRGGLGAVMGSKKLKAVVVYGENDIPVFDGPGLNNSISRVAKDIREKSKANIDFGTAGYTEVSEQLGDLPVKNWMLRQWPDVKKIGGEALAKFVTSTFHCQSCFAGCGRVVLLRKGGMDKEVGGGPEYESIACLGANCLVDDIEVIIEANELCNRYGMDTISVGSTVAFAMEAYDRGLLSEISAGPIRWGDGKVLLSMIHSIARQEGIGKMLSQGVKRAAEYLGHAATEFAVQIKGLELPAHDPRACVSSYLAYATSNRGACHLQAFSHVYELGNSEPQLGIEGDVDRHSEEGKAELVMKTQDLMSMYDAIKICKFLIFAQVHVDQVLSWYNLATGAALSLEAFMQAGGRLFSLKRGYNQRCGISRKDEKVPDRVLVEGLSGEIINFSKMLQKYYELRGYNSEGMLKEPQ
jgi:aldehyde:ferredoxin oxidoreductase